MSTSRVKPPLPVAKAGVGSSSLFLTLVCAGQLLSARHSWIRHLGVTHGPQPSLTLTLLLVVSSQVLNSID